MIKSLLVTNLLGVTLLMSAPAKAGRDNYYLGTGRDGAITISATGTPVNAYAPVIAPVATSDASILIGSTVNGSITTGDLIMIWQPTGIVPEPVSGGPGPIDVTNDPVGRWEFARVASVAGSTINLTEPLLYSYAANATQVIRVPEYTTVTINATRNITCPAWNGQTGGIVAFLATGTITNNSSPGINTTGRGFRGGQYVTDPSGSLGSTGLDETVPSGAQKGEGIAKTRYGTTQTGRGNVANGGGGGVAYRSGGGGGGGGRVLFQKGSGTCVPTASSILGGSSGVQQNAGAPGGSAYGASSGSNGSTTTFTGGFPQFTATITTPASGSTNIVRPNISGTATANSTVTIIIDNTATYTVTADAGGNYAYQPTAAQRLSDGTHTLNVYSGNAVQNVYSPTAQRTFDVSVALPVQLISFRAAAQKKQVLLQWETATEENSDRYIVERSADGKVFEAIATLMAGGNSRQQRAYSSIDAAPYAGLNLYRLKMMDKDGSSTYSGMATVNMSPEAAVTIAPNPMHDRTTVTIDARSAGTAIFSLTGLDGKVMRTYAITLQEGRNTIELQKEQLPAGIYSYRLRTADGQQLATGKLAVE